MGFRQRPGKRTTAYDIPGGLEVYFSQEGADEPKFEIVADSDSTQGPDLPDVWAAPGASFTIRTYLENRGGTGDGGPLSDPNPDNCSDPDPPTYSGAVSDNGTLVSLRHSVPDIPGWEDGRSTHCMKDDPAGKTGYLYEMGVNINDDTEPGTYEMSMWAEGGNSGTRVTPYYFADMTVTEAVEGVKFTAPDPDDGTPPDDGSTGDYSGFDLSNFESDCSITPIEDGTAAEVRVDISGTLSLNAPEGSRRVMIDLYVDGEVVTTGTGNITVNGSNGETFELRGLSEGEHEIGYELRDGGWN